MNGLLHRSAGVLKELRDGYGRELRQRVDLLVAPPATLIHSFAVVALGSRIAVGAQDCHAVESGAFTGDVSAEMLADMGATHVILGHSERRQGHGETDEDVRAKASAARRAGLAAIVCVGETRAEREGGRALDVVRGQLRVSCRTCTRGRAWYTPMTGSGRSAPGLPRRRGTSPEVHALIRRNWAAYRRLGEQNRVRILTAVRSNPERVRSCFR
jgi:triosephosphate isomerase